MHAYMHTCIHVYTHMHACMHICMQNLWHEHVEATAAHKQNMYDLLQSHAICYVKMQPFHAQTMRVPKKHNFV